MSICSCGGGDFPDENVFSNDRNYLPMGGVGSYWEYQMDSTLYDNLGATLTESVGYERHEITNVESNTPGDTIFTMKLSRKAVLSDEWIDDKFYRTEIHLDGNVYTVVDNIRFLNLKIPAMVGNTWDGIFFDPSNVIEIIEGEILIPYKNWEYLVESRDEIISVLDVERADCLNIAEASSTTLIEQRLSNAFYCKDIGLVRLERSILDSQCFSVNPDCEFEPWAVKAQKGYIMVQTLTDFSLVD